jgi:alkaline phosphatase D
MGRRKLTRREFLRGAGAATVWAAGFSRWGIASAAADGVLDNTGLSFGCAAGDVTPTGAIVWLRAERESRVSVRYGKNPQLKEFAATQPISVTRDTDFAAKITLDRLEPATAYFYQAAVEGKKPGPVNRLTTAPRRDDAADVRFAFGGDTRQTYRPFSIMDSIRAMKPDFFVHLGDTIYADLDGRARTLDQYWAKYRTNRGDQPSQNLFSETSLYVIWDDHEVENNYHRLSPLAPVGRKAFFDYWPARQDPKEPDRLYRSVRWGKAVELFILDARQYRDREKATLLGQEQKRWFLDGLASSDAWFKFVATPMPFTSPNADKWGGFPDERNEVLSLIEKKKISGVAFLTADVHYAAVTRVPGSLGLKEIIVGPLAAQWDEKAAGTAKRFEFFKADIFNYGWVKVYGKSVQPYAEVEILGKDNEPLYKTKIEAS